MDPQSSAQPTNDGRPIFIVGAMRSGTTLIRLMLNRHSLLSLPPESHFLSTLFGRFGPTGVLTESDVDDALAIVMSSAEWQRDWQSDADALRTHTARSAPRTLAAFIDVVFREEIDPTGKPYWGSKTPAHLFQIRRIRKCFPRARVIAMVRDPRDTYLSLSSRDWAGTSTWQIGSYLRRCDRLVQLFSTDGVGQFLAVRYEDLVLRAEPTLEQVCGFLGVDYEPSMLAFYVDAHQNVQQWELDIGAHDKLMRPPTADDVERWKREGAQGNVREVEAIASDALGWFGYERTIKPFEARLLRARARVRDFAHDPRRAARSVLTKRPRAGR